MKLFETHIKYEPDGDYFIIRSRSTDDKSAMCVCRSFNWLKEHCNNEIPYNWDIVKAHPDKWFLL